MWNSVRCLCTRSILQAVKTNDSLQPINTVLKCFYAANSKANNLYSNFMNTGPNLTRNPNEDKPSHWLQYNEKVYPPQDPSEPRRPAYVCHEIKNVKYSTKKLWYVCRFIRGYSVDEALKQLNLVGRKGAEIAIQGIKEAVEMAVKHHNVEFKTNLWIAECHATKGFMFKGVRRHAKGRIGIIHYRFSNFYIRLEEGTPPADYYRKGDRSGPALLEKWLAEMRNRKISNSL